jgi:hypothetical protein
MGNEVVVTMRVSPELVGVRDMDMDMEMDLVCCDVVWCGMVWLTEAVKWSLRSEVEFRVEMR